MDEIDKLVEDMAKEFSAYKDWDGAREYVKDGWRYKAKQILSHKDKNGNPDLYLKVTTVEPFSYQGVVKDTKFTKYINIADKLKEKP